MSMVPPSDHEAVEGTPRLSMTPARRKALLARQGPSCARSDCYDTWTEVDHIVPLAMGGSEADHNLEGLCAFHHRKKTSADIKAIAKAKRLERDHNPETRRQSPYRLRSGGFRPADPLKPRRSRGQP